MPSFFPEGDAPVATDPSNKSLQKINSLLQSIDSKTGSTTITGPVTVSNEVEVKNDSGNPVPVNDAGGSLTVDGSVSVSNLPASYPVTDNGGSLTVDGTVGISGTVPVSGTFWQATQPVSGSVSVSNFPATQPVSGTVGISGTVPVSGTFWQATQPVSDAGGSLTVDGSVSVSNFPATQPVSGSVTANAGIGTFAVSSTQLPTALVSDRLKVDGSGVTQPVSGSISVSNFPATQAVSGTFWPTTQPVSGSVTANAGTGTFAVSSTQLPSTLSGDKLKVDGSGVTQPISGTVGISGTVPVSGTFWQATQPISGTVTATQATAANLNATVVGSGSFTAQQATAANLNATVVQATATNLRTQAENYQGGSAVGSANPLQVTLANTGSNATAVKVDGSGVTQPVSDNGGSLTVDGTVTANLADPDSVIPVFTAAYDGQPAIKVGGAGDDGMVVAQVSGTVMLRGSNGSALDDGGFIPTSPEKATTPNVFTFSEEGSAVLVEDNFNRKVITIFNSSPNTLYLILGDNEVSDTNYSFALGEKELLVLTNITCWINGVYPDGGTAYVTEIT